MNSLAIVTRQTKT